MEHIDVHDLSEDEARLIAAFVELLRRSKHGRTPREGRQAEAISPIPSFAVWPLGVKGTLGRDEIYDHL